MKLGNISLVLLLPILLISRAAAQVSFFVNYIPVDFGAQMLTFQLNNVGGNFIFDTGMSRTTITEAMVKRLNLRTTPAVSNDGKPVILDGRQAQMVKVAQGTIGTVPIEDLRCLVVSKKKMETLFEQPVDGVLGMNFTYGFATLIDFQTHTLTFFSETTISAATLKRVDMEDSIVLPLVEPSSSYNKDFLIAVRARINDSEEENLVIDTGSAKTMISAKMATKLKLKPLSQGNKKSVSDKGVRVNKAKVTTLKLGKVLMKGVTIEYHQNNEMKYQPHLGLDVLTKFRILLDIPGKKLYLKPLDALRADK